MVDEQSDAEAIRNQLAAMSRDPFLQELSVLLGQTPDPEKVKDFGNRFPDRWAQAVAIFARTAGFSERLEVDSKTSNLTVLIQSMSDAELLRELAKSEAKLKALHAGPKKKALKPGGKRKKAGEPEK